MSLKSEIVRCGYNKWSMSVGENGEVMIEYNYHPIYGSISLHDASIEDFRNLGEMFLSVAHTATMHAKEVKKA